MRRTLLVLLAALLAIVVSTAPAAAGTRRVLEPGDRGTFTLAPRGNCMAYKAGVSGGVKGTVRVKVGAAGTWGVPGEEDFGAVTATASVRLPKGSYTLALASVYAYDEATGEVEGCAYFGTDFIVTNPHKPTRASVITPVHKGEPTRMMAWITPADDTSIQPGRLATSLFWVSTAP